MYGFLSVWIMHSKLTALQSTKPTSQRFELWRAEPNRFLIYLLNHSDMMSSACKLCANGVTVTLKLPKL